MPMLSVVTSFFCLYELYSEKVGNVLSSCDGYVATLK